MDQVVLFALVGLGAGAAYAALAQGLVATYKGIGIVNFAAGAMAMWSAYVYDELVKTGDLVVPVVVVPHRVHLLDGPPVAVGLAAAMASAAVLGLAVHVLVFRPLRRAPVLAKVVASVGVMLTLQALVVLHFGSSARRVEPILPSESVTVAGQPVPRDRLLVAGIVVVIGVVLWAYYRFTRTGLATRAAAESERSAGLAGFSPQRLAGVTWVLSSVVVGTVLTLAAPTLGLNPTTFVLLVVPGLACALAGRLTSVGAVTAAGLALGVLQSEIGFYSTKTWWPEWAKTGLGDAVPFLVVVVSLAVVGRSLPSRGATQADPLPAAVIPRNRPPAIAALVALGLVLLVMTDGTYRFGVITSMIFAILALSLVVLTGLLGLVGCALSAGLAGLGGSLIGYSRGQLSAESFTVLAGVSLVAYAYLGGITSIVGALLAGLVAPLGLSYVLVNEVLDDLAEVYLLVTGVSLVLSAIFNPVGAAGVMRERWSRLRRRLRPARPTRSALASASMPVSANGQDEASPALQRVRRRRRGSTLEVRDLAVRYGGVLALRGVSLDVAPGEVVGLIGPNGAGKTTLIDAVTGFTPHRGTVRLGGESLDGLGAHRRSRKGLARTWQSIELFDDLSVRDNLRVAVEPATARSVLLDLVHPVRDGQAAAVEAALATVGLAHRAGASPQELSLGQQKMAGVARALVADPEVLLLDEPAAGLDAAESRVLGEQLRRVAAGGPAILLVDHDMDLVLAVCDHVYVLVFGEIVAEGPPDALRGNPAVIEAYLGASARAVSAADPAAAPAEVGP